MKGAINQSYRRKPFSATVRLARPKEDLEISSLFLEWLNFGTLDERGSEIRKAIKAKEMIVAKDGRTKNLIGFIHSIIHNDPISSGPLEYITAFYVRKQFRGRGLGSRMLQLSLKKALQNGAVGAEVSTSHPRAVKLYKRFGFSQFKSEFGEIQLGLSFRRTKSANQLLTRSPYLRSKSGV